MEITKEDIIIEYNKLKKHLGFPPSATKFFSETRFSNRQVEKIFGSDCYSKLVLECGDRPNRFGIPKSDFNEILIQWGNLARKLGKMPVGADWRFNKCKPSVEGIKVSHNINWTELPYKFSEFYSANEEWSDVLALIPNRSNTVASIETKKIAGLTFETLKFIPPIVQDLVELSIDEKKSREFEKSVNLIFQMLGFEVTDYGQGTGRNPDGVAKENQHRYVVLIDAKSRKDKYKMGTEDRKFIEYIKTFSEPLRKSGFTKIYFLIVSSSFDSISATAIKNISVETQVATILLSSRLLLKLLSHKIQTPRIFDLKKFQELLIESGEMTEKKIDRFISQLK